MSCMLAGQKLDLDIVPERAQKYIPDFPNAEQTDYAFASSPNIQARVHANLSASVSKVCPL